MKESPCPARVRASQAIIADDVHIMSTADDAGAREVLRAAREALAAGRLSDAHAQLQARLAQQPDDVDALHTLGLVQRHQGRLHEAIACLERALQLRERDAQGWNNLGGFRREAGDPAGAAVAFERALAVDPEHAGSLFNAAALAHARNEPARAAALLQRLLARRPGDAEAWNLLGLAQADAQRVDDALASLRRAVALAPGVASVHNNLGVVLGYAARGEEARAAFREALRVDPGSARAWENLVRSARVREADAGLLEAMQQALARSSPTGDDALCLHFALGKALDDLGRHAQAFEHFRRGNGLIAGRVAYSPRAHDDFVDAMIDAFDPALVERLRGAARATACPVFVLGMPRSGTTLVEQVIAAHPSVCAGGELDVVPRAVQALEAAAGAPLPAAAARAGAPHLEAFARTVEQAMARRANGAPHVSDKLPGNYLYLGLLHALLPAARIVHCRRDARDTCLSIYFQRFAHGHEFACSLPWIAARHRSYRRLMAHWRTLLGPRLVEVDYEALVAQPHAQAERLYRALDLDFSPGYLDAVGKGGTVMTASSWQVRRPIGAGSVGRWQDYAAYLGELDAALTDD
jgi:tetratricopeptide (TPR) repeat protein